MKKIILLVCGFGFLHTSYGQQLEINSRLSSIAKIDLGFQGIGFTYEPRLSNSLTMDLSAGVGGGYNISEESLEYEMLKPALYFSVTPKYYYNLQKRIAKGKTVLHNSGNYIGLRFTFNSPLYNKTDIIRRSILTNLHWGIQRAIGSRWTINSHVGIGYSQDIEYDFGTIYPALDFKFSYIL